MKRIQVRRGLCAVLEDRECKLALELARASELIVYVQLSASEHVENARRAADRVGLYGTRVYVEKGSAKKIHLAGNLADAVIARGDASNRTPEREILRVLRPGGKAILGRKEIAKPFPEGLDDWSHRYHGPDNNPRSHDRLARAPYVTQFLGEPWYCPQPQVTVASAGRIFKAFGHRGSKHREWQWLDTLIAMNGFNGTILWKRALAPGFMSGRNTIVAAPDTLYLADDASCKLLDAAGGALKGEIVPSRAAPGESVWKWMALEDGVLYAMLGGKEPPAGALRGTRTGVKGWYFRVTEPYLWGFGRSVLAVDPDTKRTLWRHRAKTLIDGRAICMKNGRIFYYCQNAVLRCLDARTGKTVWENADAGLLEAIGKISRSKSTSENFSYLKCDERAVYVEGQRIVAVSAKDGRPIWTCPADRNLFPHIVVRDDGVYTVDKKLDPLTGKVLARIRFKGGNCTRPTGSVDSLFRRGGGTLRLDLATNRSEQIAAMRPACGDGVIVANGLLYWGPWMCDCPHCLVGVICLGPKDGSDSSRRSDPSKRLERGSGRSRAAVRRPESDPDWPTYRADNAGSAGLQAAIPEKVKLLWRHSPKTPVVPTAPVVAGGMILFSGSDGVVRALDSKTGKPRWSAYTGGPIHYPPSVWKGRAYVGSGDGWVYAFEAAAGNLSWRFRAAPAERKIMAYGSLVSTWPVAGGVLVDDGVAYAACGIAEYDGTHVYALDAATGELRWRNDSSRTVDPRVAVQGHMLLHDGRLYLAGGGQFSPAVFDAKSGEFIKRQTRYPYGTRPGRDLFLTEDGVKASGQLLYSPEDDFPERGYILRASADGTVIAQVVQGKRGPHKIARLRHAGSSPLPPGRLWETRTYDKNTGLVLAKNAVLASGRNLRIAGNKSAESSFGITALDVKDGHPLWTLALPAAPVSWGMALDREGRIFVTLRDGRVLCFGQ